MNFQLHLPHGLVVFLGLSILVSLFGFYSVKFLTRKSSNNADDRGGNAVGGFFFTALGAMAAILAVVMSFLCPYAAYPALVAVFFFAAAVSAFAKA